MADDTGRGGIGRTAIVVMGPSGVGKTTTAKLLSERLGWRFAEADEFHPQANIDKMKAGVPLEDADRWPWLDTIRDWIAARGAEGENVVVTCSALKRSYRDVLTGAEGVRVRFLQLEGEVGLVETRMKARRHHYMPPSLLASQFSTLEPLQLGEDGVAVSVDTSPDAVADHALAALGLQAPAKS
ncbi:gluconokinase [Antarcticirhabdus aurantiaca]|uniref:Gluconokinase, GntK/IdnK-type n=1 Tax=Antarcticirhabdus aurantiaca TaxID=2606717 RepID=A0ACD4NPR8_9HYPH|nr:gluconokinase [Antarcticirhabdus aurantiaca]WAJ28655.1 gluconokinase, GntK/IdnK-type [Jeongeuplla avenae]